MPKASVQSASLDGPNLYHSRWILTHGHGFFVLVLFVGGVDIFHEKGSAEVHCSFFVEEK